MSKKKLPKTKPPLKFGRPTKQFSVRLPIDIIDRIKDEEIDAGTILFNAIEYGQTPSDEPVYDKGPVIVKKLVQLMIEQEVVAPEGFFDESDIVIIQKIARGEL